MDRIYKVVIISLFTCLNIFCTDYATAQAKNAIGIGLAVNGSKQSTGAGVVLQGEIRTGRSFALVPSIGVEIPYVGYVGIAGKYYFVTGMYCLLGGFLHVGGDDAGDSGPGGTAGWEVEILSSRKHSIDLNLHADLLQIDGKLAPLGGLRLIYSFSFSKKH